MAEEIEEVEIDKTQEEKYISSLRSANTKENDEETAGSDSSLECREVPRPKESTSHEVQHPQVQPTKQPQEKEHDQSLTIHRNIEELEAIEKYRRSAAQLYVNSYPFSSESAGQGSSREYQALLAAGLSEENIRDVLSRYVSEAAIEFKDNCIR